MIDSAKSRTRRRHHIMNKRCYADDLAAKANNEVLMMMVPTTTMLPIKRELFQPIRISDSNIEGGGCNDNLQLAIQQCQFLAAMQNDDCDDDGVEESECREAANASERRSEKNAVDEERLGLVSLLMKTDLLNFVVCAETDGEEEDLYESSVRVEIPGINASSLTYEEQTFLEEQLLESFSTSFHGTDYTLVSSYFIDKDEDQLESFRSLNKNALTNQQPRSVDDTWRNLFSDLTLGVNIGVDLQKLVSEDNAEKLQAAGDCRKGFGVQGSSEALRLRHCFRINKNRATGPQGIRKRWQEEFKRCLLVVQAIDNPFDDAAFDAIGIEDITISLERVYKVEQPEDPGCSLEASMEGPEALHIERWRNELMKTLVMPQRS